MIRLLHKYAKYVLKVENEIVHITRVIWKSISQVILLKIQESDFMNFNFSGPLSTSSDGLEYLVTFKDQ